MTTHKEIKVLDHGYVRLIESYGKGDAGVSEAGIIEAARQSTQGSFRGWELWECESCGQQFNNSFSSRHSNGSEVSPVICVGKLKLIGGDSKLLKYLYDHKHSTPFEFAGMVIEIQAPIMVFREWHRHRTQSYNEMSARYEPLPNLNYLPTIDRLFATSETNKQAKGIGDTELSEINAANFHFSLETFYMQAETLYQQALEFGIPKELARLVIPVGRYSRMRAAANLRNWIAFLTLRDDPKAQYEIRMFAQTVASIIEEEFPRTYKLYIDNKGK